MSRVLALSDSKPPHAAAARHTLVLADEVSLAVLHQVERVAASEATVLIVGETGTGKELIARHVHTCSGRAGPFIAVNCGAFAENLIDAELFGHEAGAYTGAGASREGWFEAAQGGTLFLDEIGDLPQPLQVKLLRVLQERQVVRLGSRKAIDVNVRLVAATNVDLAQAVEDGRFRRDLYYRLNIATLYLPPLSQRPADILALAEHFIALYSHRLGLSGVTLSDQAHTALLAHPWPGNIRELENVIHYALIVGHGRSIEVEALNLQAPHGGTAQPEERPDERPVAGRDSAALPLDSHGLDLLRRGLRGLFEVGGGGLYAAIERDVVQVAYEFCHRNQVHTAELLGISRNVLRAQLKRFGLLPDRGRQSSELPGAPSTAVHFTTTDLADACDGQPTGEASWAA